jgi:hypothetical protein
MTFSKMAAAAALLTLMPLPAMAAMNTAEQCTAMFEKADTNKDGEIGQQEEASKYAAMVTGNTEDNSSTGATALIIKKDRFMEFCQKAEATAQ